MSVKTFLSAFLQALLVFLSLDVFHIVAALGSLFVLLWPKYVHLFCQIVDKI